MSQFNLFTRFSDWFSFLQPRKTSTNPHEAASPSRVPTISQAALDLILKYEVSSKAYYERFLAKPSWPGLSSGVTIGIGYDLGYNTRNQFKADWGPYLSEHELNILTSAIGVKGVKAAPLIKFLRTVVVPWEAAVAVFTKSTVPRFIKATLAVYPEAAGFHPDVLGALVSLVFNRGASTEGSRRKEMAMLKEAVKFGDLAQIESLIRRMKRLWAGSKFVGLLKRRDAEADLVKLHA
jgi:hypothetical protein